MPSGVALSGDLCGVLVKMHISAALDAKAISYFTGIPIRTIYRVLANFKRTGEAKPAPTGQRGRPRALDFADTQVGINCEQIQEKLTTLTS